MLSSAQGSPMGGSDFQSALQAGTALDCASASGAAPCQYAAMNGYSSPGLTAGQESNDVTVSFPASVSGVTDPGAAVAGPHPFIRVDLVDRVRVYFSSLLTASHTLDVRTAAKCGLVTSSQPIPIVVLNPTCTHAFEDNGSAKVKIIGGPTRSIQVNSSDPTCAAATKQSGCTSTSNLAIDLSQGGPNLTGSDFGVFGGPTGSAAPPSPSVFNGGSTGQWLSPASPVPDPFKTLPAPAVPSAAPAPKTVPYGTDGCPDQGDVAHPSKAPAQCTEYSPGLYTGAIQIATGTTAIFQPGVYYITGTVSVGTLAAPGNGCLAAPSGQGRYGLVIGSNVVVRPTNPNAAKTTTGVAGDGSGGTMFYLSGTGTGAYGSVLVYQSAGQYGDPSGGGTRTIDDFSTSLLTCGATPDVPIPIPSGHTGLPGNIFLAPCTGTYGDQSTAYQSGTGTAQYRGMLFFQDRNNGDPNAQPKMQGGAAILLGGDLYFHSTGYKAFFNLQGTPGSSTYVYGNIITDELVLGGTAEIDMQLNNNQMVTSVKAALLQ